MEPSGNGVRVIAGAILLIAAIAVLFALLPPPFWIH